MQIATHPDCLNIIHWLAGFSPSPCSISDLGCFYAAPGRSLGRMPGSIQISDIQPPVTAPLFLQVAVGKREYRGNIGHDGFSFPVTSLRDSMVMTLYNADKELVSKTEVNTKAIVELGTMDVVFSLRSGGKVILQLRFLLSDEDRKRVQEMRNAVVKRKQKELLVNDHELCFQDRPLPKEQTGEISDIPRKGDPLSLRKSVSLDDLKENDVFPGVSVDSDLAASKDLPLQTGGNTSMLGNPVGIDSKKGQGKPETRLSSAVKKMISAFESTSPQGGPPSVPRIKSESSLEGMLVSSETSTNSSIKPPTRGTSPNVPSSMRTGHGTGTPGKVTIPSADTGSSSRPGKQVMFSDKKANASRQTRVSNTSENRRRSSSRQDGTAKTSMVGDNRSIPSDNRSAEKHRRRSIGAYSPEQQKSNRSAAVSSITWIHPHLCITTASRQLRNLVDLEHLNSVRNIESNVREETEKSKSGDDMRDAAVLARESPVLNGWLINQGVRAVIVIIACGAVFVNNR